MLRLVGPTNHSAGIGLPPGQVWIPPSTPRSLLVGPGADDSRHENNWQVYGHRPRERS